MSTIKLSDRYCRPINELIELEQSFRHNLALLRIKSTEIERCNDALRKMEIIKRENAQEISNLKRTTDSLEDKLREIERERYFERESFDKSTKRLEKELVESEEDARRQRDLYEAEMVNLRIQFEERLAQFKYANEEKRAKEIEDVKEELLAERAQIAQTEQLLAELSTENRQLKEKLLQIEAKCSTNKFNDKNQLNQLTDCNEMLRKELKECKTNSRHQIDELIALKKERSDLLQVINCERQQSVRLKSELVQFHTKTTELQSQIERTKKLESCTIKGHENYDDLIKQNDILQEVVKEMRRERAEHLKNVKSMEDAIKRIEYLESVLEMLKDEPDDDQSSNS